MKVVIFAGGLGTRMREETEFRPKPMVEIGGKPVLWHLMKIYSHYGFGDFIVLAGYKANVIKEYFSRLDLFTRDFTFHTDSGNLDYLTGRKENWKITVLDTGPESQTGDRLKCARELINGETFCCTYGDGLAPVDISTLVKTHFEGKTSATMTVVRPANRFGVVEFDSNNIARSFLEKPRMSDWINMGFFVFGPEIFSHLDQGKSLEEGALTKLAAQGELSVFPYDGFWEPMDTFREFQKLNDLWISGRAPWKVWE